LHVWCCVVKYGLDTLIVIMILKDRATFQVLFIVYQFVLGSSLLCRSTVAFTYLKVKSVKCLCLLPVVLVLRIWSCLHHCYKTMLSTDWEIQNCSTLSKLILTSSINHSFIHFCICRLTTVHCAMFINLVYKPVHKPHKPERFSVSDWSTINWIYIDPTSSLSSWTYSAYVTW